MADDSTGVDPTPLSPDAMDVIVTAAVRYQSLAVVTHNNLAPTTRPLATACTQPLTSCLLVSAAATTLNAVAAMDPSPLADSVLVRYKTSLVLVVGVSVGVPV